MTGRYPGGRETRRTRGGPGECKIGPNTGTKTLLLGGGYSQKVGNMGQGLGTANLNGEELDR